ncbi:MAG TPA: cation-transporting P-type ATPase, partial [Candidatus Baltobacteraceae bacterium]|nr:cation-transporting P-type ATPase [Candidatus Baltobacteraceae bacterium]
MELTSTQAAALDAAQVCARLESSPQGLTSEQAARRLSRIGANVLREHRLRAAAILWRQLRNPLLLLLLAAAAASVTVGEHVDAYIILAIIAMSAGLGFVNEYRSERAMLDLHRRVRHRALALRDGAPRAVDVAELVPGDVVELAMGDIVPADVRLCETHDLECDQSVLTGESLPVTKAAQPINPGVPFAELSNCAFMGTVVKSGDGRGVVVATGARTAFGDIAMNLMKQPPETAFQLGLRSFSRLLVYVTLILTAAVFAVNAALHHPLLESL